MAFEVENHDLNMEKNPQTHNFERFIEQNLWNNSSNNRFYAGKHLEFFPEFFVPTVLQKQRLK